MGLIHRTTRVTRTATAAVAVGLGLLGTGCGGGGEYRNEARPPTPIVVSASIGPSEVSVSPREFGAGPITLIVTNQSDRSQELTLETDEIGGENPGIKQNSGPINPGDTASLKADLAKGTYRVAVGDRGIDGATLNVGDKRRSAQDELLQP